MLSLPVRKFSLAILSGFLLTAAFPSIDLHLAAWFSLVPLLIAIKGEPPLNAFKLGIVAGLAHYITLLYWIFNVISTYGGLNMFAGILILFLLCIYLSLYTGVFSFLVMNFIGSRIKIFLFAGFWTSLEYIRAEILTGFPWCLLGYSQFNQNLLIQIADITGVYGISFIIAAVNILIFILVSDIRKSIDKKYIFSEALLLAVIIALAVSYGSYRVKEYSGDAAVNKVLNISIIQGNIDQAVKWDSKYEEDTIKKYLSLTENTYDFNPDIIIWPETSIPFFFQDNNDFTGVLYDIPKRSGAHFIFGSPSYRSEEREISYMNSAFSISPDGNLKGQYDKMHLVPFGEYVPLKKLLPFVHRLVPAAGDFSPGESLDPLVLNGISSGILICYEAIFPEISRELTEKGARVLINITNDAWFGLTSAPYQHLYMSIFRAIENRIPLIRSANTGFSGIISPTGTVKALGGLFTSESITGNVRIEDHPLPFYSRFGDIFAHFILIICLIKTCFEISYRRFTAKRQKMKC
ncbi:apolipoprotein N-acyltransferase [Thermodesulfobacteriota bacterium]